MIMILILLLLKNIELIFQNFKENNLKIYQTRYAPFKFYFISEGVKEFYLSKNKLSMNDIINLQEGFGLYIE